MPVRYETTTAVALESTSSFSLTGKLTLFTSGVIIVTQMTAAHLLSVLICLCWY